MVKYAFLLIKKQVKKGSYLQYSLIIGIKNLINKKDNRYSANANRLDAIVLHE